MKKKCLLLSLFSFCCISCLKKENSSITDFDTVEKVIAYDSIFADIDEPWGPIVGLEVFGNTLVLSHMNDEYKFSFIDIERGENVCRWGTKGEGTNEFIDFGSNFSIRDSILIFQTPAKKEINYISLSDILNHNVDVQVRKEKYPYDVDFRPRRIYPINDKKIAIGSFKDGLIGVLGKDNTIIPCESEFPFSYEEVGGIFRGNLFQSQVIPNEKNNRFVISIFSSDIFEIYEMNGLELRKIYVSPFKFIPRIWKKGERYAVDYDNSIAGLMSMSASSNLICFTYSSQSYTEAVREDMVSNEILCFNWNGEKIKKYVLPFAISNFCLDENYLYGVRYVSDKTVIYRFKL